MSAVLARLASAKGMTRVESGALVTTETGDYYLSVGLGKVSFEETDYFVISPVSPIGQAMLGKKTGEAFEVNGRNQKIEKIL